MPYYRKPTFRKYARKAPKNYSRPAFRKSYKKTAKGVSSAVKKFVKMQIAKDVETKISTPTTTFYEAVISRATGSATNLYMCPPLANIPNIASNPFYLFRGPNQGEFSGNKIKLKRWLIKGSITQNADVLNNPALGLGSNSLYVKLYIGYRKDYQPVTSTLSNFYEAGSATIDPSGASADLGLSVNKELYRVLWTKTFKIGNNSNNNDFNLCKTFGVNICNYLFKNATLTYPDGGNLPVANPKLQAMTFWAVAINGNGTALPTTVGPLESQASVNFFQMIEYEDA